MATFNELNLSEPLLKTIAAMHFEIPSEIQEKTIPLTLEGKDVIAGSATGSGKTLAFGACLIEKLETGKGIQSLILVPTRELAEQVANALISFSRHKDLNIIAVYGGVGIDQQIRNLRGSEIVVGTPGRILDHMQRRTIDLSKVKVLVLDEADRMLDMGFQDDVERIISHCPKDRQTLLFSATISPDITLIAKKYMKHPIEVEADNQVDPKKLTQVYYDVDSGVKFSALVHLLKDEKSELVLVFCNTRHNADFVTRNLRENGIHAKVIHGGLSQSKRSDVLEEFHKGEVLVLVCTDIAARGLDIKGVSHVYNYDVPKVGKDYIHRIGRTARAGKEGKAITILAARDYDNFRSVLRDPDIKIEKLELPYVEKAKIVIEERRGRGDRESFRGRGNFRSAGSYRDRGSSRGRSEGRSSSRESRSGDRDERRSSGFRSARSHGGSDTGRYRRRF